MGEKTRHVGAFFVAALAVSLGLGLGCAGGLSSPVRYEYFSPSPPNDAWSRKIRLWQARERIDLREASDLAPVAGDGAAHAGAGDDRDSGASVDGEFKISSTQRLRLKYETFLGERKRAMARELAEWIQVQAREHYVPDGPIDHWATLEETFIRNGDDCDGLELLTYHLLRDLGFGADEVFRAIVFRRKDGQHHMVTLWFEDANDPWVIDPTGAMTSGMPRMSGVPGWTPLKIFTEDTDFTVQPDNAAERLAKN